MILTFKTVKEWEDYGLLAELPEERKQMVVECFNTASKWLIEGSLVTLEEQGDVETLILPLFYRIAKIVDLTEAEVLEICRDFRHAWLTKDADEAESHYNAIDFELMFLSKFAEMKINQYKQK